jgi:hypothetical protein
LTRRLQLHLEAFQDPILGVGGVRLPAQNR